LQIGIDKWITSKWNYWGSIKSKDWKWGLVW
jgi:hypothetical protein